MGEIDIYTSVTINGDKYFHGGMDRILWELGGRTPNGAGSGKEEARRRWEVSLSGRRGAWGTLGGDEWEGLGDVGLEEQQAGP